MILITLKRICKAGFINFWRNGFVSFASVLVITETLFVIGSLMFMSAVLHLVLDALRDKVDINVYFVTTAEEENILALVESVRVLPEVESVSYTSRDDALREFRDRHAGDTLTLQALEELGDNPLGANVNIKAREPSQYESIARFLEGRRDSFEEESASIIDRINYSQNKTAIDRLTQIIDGAELFGYALVAIFAFIAITITFNTIRLAIYTSREEISVMRLVGADNRYIRGPFLVEGFMYGTIAAAIALIAFFPLTLWISRVTREYLGGIDVFQYYRDNFFEIASVLLIAGIGLGVISSFFAVRRYISKKYLKL